MRIQFQNFEDGPVIDVKFDRVKATDAHRLACCNTQRGVALIAMIALGETSASVSDVRDAMLAAVDNLRAEILAAEVVEMPK